MAKGAKVGPEKLRAWWSHRQGLDGGMAGADSADVLARTGWARSVGGAGPYLTLFARAGLSRATVDVDVAELRIHELPSARGCTYVVPAADFALALKVSRGPGDSQDIATAKKSCGVTDRELDRLAVAVLDALADGPLDPRELKEAVGDAVRSLGAEGKKRGMSTTVPLVLGRLQNHGEIRRVSVDGRVDRQRYRYAKWEDSPAKAFRASFEEAHTLLAERYFRWIGPATMANFRWFSGLGVKAAKSAVAPLPLVALPAKGDDPPLMFANDLERLEAFKPPAKPQVTLVGSLDGISMLRRDAAALVDPADAGRTVLSDSGSKPLGGLADFHAHAILDRGRLVGLWEFDPGTGAIVAAAFGKPPAGTKEAIARMERFVRDDLGDARSFSLDSPESRAPRLAALRAPAW